MPHRMWVWAEWIHLFLCVCVCTYVRGCLCTWMWGVNLRYCSSVITVFLRQDLSLASDLGPRLGWPTLEDRDIPVILVVLHFQLQAILTFWHRSRALNLGLQAWKPITWLTWTVSPPCGICLGFANVAQRANPFTSFPVLKASNASSSLGGHNLCETADGHPKYTSIKILSIRSFLMGV